MLTIKQKTVNMTLKRGYPYSNSLKLSVKEAEHKAKTVKLSVKKRLSIQQ